MRKQTSDVDRQRVIDSYLADMSPTTIAEVLGMKRTTIYSILSVYRAENRIERLRGGRPRRKILNEEHRDQIRAWVDEDCSVSLAELARRCHETLHVQVSPKTVDRCLSHFHYSFKRVSLQPERRNDEVALNQRADYAIALLRILSTTPHELIYFLDEVGFSVSMRSRHGRALRGARAVHVVRAIKSRNISIMCSMNKDGIFQYSSQSQAFKTVSFCAALENLFIEFQRHGIHNAVLVMDNAPIHRPADVRSLCERFGHIILYLPPYSPFLNPIENMFSKWKEGVRRSRVVDEPALMEVIEHGATLITANDCGSYFRHMLGFLDRCLSRSPIIDE